MKKVLCIVGILFGSTYAMDSGMQALLQASQTFDCTYPNSITPVLKPEVIVQQIEAREKGCRELKDRLSCMQDKAVLLCRLPLEIKKELLSFVMGRLYDDVYVKMRMYKDRNVYVFKAEETDVTIKTVKYFAASGPWGHSMDSCRTPHSKKIIPELLVFVSKENAVKPKAVAHVFYGVINDLPIACALPENYYFGQEEYDMIFQFLADEYNRAHDIKINRIWQFDGFGHSGCFRVVDQHLT